MNTSTRFKRLIITALSFLMTQSLGTAQAAPDDLIIQSRLDQSSLSWLIDKTRVIMANAEMRDGLSSTVSLPNDPQIGFSEISSDPMFAQIQALVSEIFHVNMTGSVLRIRIPKISYRIESIHANPKAIQVNDPVLSLTTTALLNGVDIGLTNGLQVDLMIPNPTTHVLQSYMTATIDPASISIPRNLPPASFEVSFQTIRDQRFHFNLTGFNLDALPKYVREHEPDLIIHADSTHSPITVNQIKINPVIVRLGPLSRTLQFDAFKPLIQRKLNSILSQVILGVGNSLKTTIGPQILNTVFSLSTTSDLVVTNDAMYARYDTAAFAQPARDQLAFHVAGSMCTPRLYAQYREACIEHTLPFTPVRTLSEEDKVAAQAEITAKLESHAADIAASVTEDYVNRLLKTLIESDSWSEELASSHLSFGEKRAFIVFDRATTTPDIVLDLIYSGDGTFPQRLVVNERHPIHFPLRMSTSLSFGVRDGKSFMTVKTNQVLSDVDEIINGLPQYGMNSTLVFGLRHMVAKMILKMANQQGKTAIDIELPEFRGVGLEQTSYEVSPYGRVNLYFKINPNTSPTP